MPVEVACPSCGIKLSVPDDFVGKKVRCASCSLVFDANPQAPPPELPRSANDLDGEQHDQADDDYPFDTDDERLHRRRDLVPHRGGLILTLGIGSIVGAVLEMGVGICCCSLPIISIPLGAVSWILGHGDLRQLDNGIMDPDGRSSTKAGYVCGMVGCGMGLLGLVCVGIKTVYWGWMLQQH
jgi:hypothetical protein